jgi:hypothetical protein
MKTFEIYRDPALKEELEGHPPEERWVSQIQQNPKNNQFYWYYFAEGSKIRSEDFYKTEAESFHSGYRPATQEMLSWPEKSPTPETKKKKAAKPATKKATKKKPKKRQ